MKWKALKRVFFIITLKINNIHILFNVGVRVYVWLSESESEEFCSSARVCMPSRAYK